MRMAFIISCLRACLPVFGFAPPPFFAAAIARVFASAPLPVGFKNPPSTSSAPISSMNNKSSRDLNSLTSRILNSTPSKYSISLAFLFDERLDGVGGATQLSRLFVQRLGGAHRTFLGIYFKHHCLARGEVLTLKLARTRLIVVTCTPSTRRRAVEFLRARSPPLIACGTQRLCSPTFSDARANGL